MTNRRPSFSEYQREQQQRALMTPHSLSQNSQPPPLESSIDRQSGLEWAIFGPVTFALRFSGFSLEKNECPRTARKGCRRINQFFAILRLIFFLLMFGLVMWRLVELSQKKAPIISIAWCQQQFHFFVAMHGAASMLMLAAWTKTGKIQAFLTGFAEVARKLTGNSASLAGGLCRPIRVGHVLALVLAIIWMATVAATEGRRILYDEYKNSTDENEPKFDFGAARNLFGLEPLAGLIGGFASILVILLYALAHHAVLEELGHFNEQLVEAAKNHHLRHVDMLASQARRHLDLLEFIRAKLNGWVEASTSLGCVAYLVGHALLMFGVFSQSDRMTPFYMAVSILWMLLTGAALGIILMMPARVQQKLGELRRSILFEKDIWEESTDSAGAGADQQQLQKRALVARTMLERAQDDSNKIVLMQAFHLTETLPHKILLIMPLVANGLLLVYKLRTNQDVPTLD